jgi:hypothetical protein
MRSFLNTLLGWLGLAPPRLRCRAVIWNEGVQELARRTLGGRRESGAYLLGRHRRDVAGTFSLHLLRRCRSGGAVHGHCLMT